MSKKRMKLNRVGLTSAHRVAPLIRDESLNGEPKRASSTIRGSVMKTKSSSPHPETAVLVPPRLKQQQHSDLDTTRSPGITHERENTTSSLRTSLATARKELRSQTSSLRQVSGYLKTLLNNIPIPLVIVGRDLRLRYASRDAMQILNLASFDSRIKITDTMLALHVVDLKKLILHVMRKGEVLSREIQDENGVWRLLWLEPYEMTTHAIDGAVVTLFNIDAQKRVETSLEEERRMVQQMLGGLDGIVVLLDEGGCVMRVNRKGAELLGRDELEIVGKNWFDTVISEASRSEARSRFTQLMSGEENHPGWNDLFVTLKNGQKRLIRWCSTVLTDTAGTRIGMVGSGEDITLWREAQLSAVESEERFKQLIGMEPESDFLTLDTGGNITGWYAGPRSPHVYRAEEVIGKHVSIFFPTEDFLAGKPMRMLRVAETRGRSEEEGWCVSKDGAHRRARFSISPSRDAGNNLIGFAATIRYLEDYIRVWRD